MKATNLACHYRNLAVTLLFVFVLSQSVAATSPAFPFAARMDYGIGPEPLDIAVGDLNSDGNLDLVTVNSGSSNAGSVSVLLGNPDGTFQPAVSYPTLATSFTVRLGDFNGDGKLDILVASQSTSVLSTISVSVLIGNGDGTFQAPKTTGIANSNSRFLAIGHFSGNGTLDIALPVAVPQLGNSAIAVMQGNGDGTFQSPVTVSAGPFPSPLFFDAGDFNNDGKLDLIYEYCGTSGCTTLVFLSNGDGTFQQPKSTPSSCSIAADFTGDGKLDCAFGNTAGGISVLPGNGNGTFGSAVNTSFLFAASLSFFAADINGDGKQDLVLIDGLNSVITVFLAKGDGSFQPGLSSGLPGSFAAFGDFNKDGKLDIAIGPSTDTTGLVSVAFGNGDGTFQLAPVIENFGEINMIGDLEFPVSVVAGDFTSDKHIDLLEILDLQMGGSAVFVVLPGNGNGTFQPLTARNVGVRACNAIDGDFPSCSSVAGDFNGDGKLDVAMTGTDTLHTQNPVGVFLGNGDGTFQSEVDYNGGGNSITLGDINGDGILDLVTSSGSTNNISILLGNGDGTFGFANPVAVSGTANFVMAADFNNDGKLDLAVGMSSGVAILLSKGNGTFMEADIPLAAGPTTLAVGDFLGNGRLDIVAGSSSSNSVTVLLNNGAGAFTVGKNYTVTGNVVTVSVSDFNGDGIPDLAILNLSDESIFLGNGDGTFRPSANFGTSTNTSTSYTQVAIGNFNGSGNAIAVGLALLMSRGGTTSFGLGPANLSATVTAGQKAIYTLSIGGGDFDGTANLTCSGAPKGATCSLPATQEVSRVSMATFSVTVTTSPRTSGVVPASRMHITWLWALALAGVAILPASVPRTSRVLCGLLIPMLLLFVASCGGSGTSSGGSSSGGGSTDTPAGTYTLTVTATAGPMTQSLPLSLTVQ